MNLRNSILIFLIFIWGCKNDGNTIVTIGEICECYKNQQVPQIDERLIKCVYGFNELIISQNTSTEQKEKSLKGLHVVKKELIETCSFYQTDFNKVLLSRYESQDTILSNAERESTMSNIKRGVNSAVSKVILAEYEIMHDNYEVAMDLILESISEKSDLDKAYWVRGFLHHRNGDFDKAINDYCTLQKSVKNQDTLLSIELLKLNLNKEKLKTEHNK